MIFVFSFALFFSALMWPLQVRFARRTPPLLASIGAFFCVFAVFAALGIATLLCLRDTQNQARSRGPQYLDAMRLEYSSLQDWGAPRGIEFPLASEIRESLGSAKNILKTGARRKLALASALILLAAIAMSCLDARRLRHRKERDDARVLDTIYGLSEKLHRHFATRLESASMLGTSTFAFTVFVGLDFALFWGLLAAMLSFIPYLSALLTALLLALWALFQFHSPPAAALVFIGCILIQWLVASFAPSKYRAEKFQVAV